jgi:uncharacterized protein (UPF0305 family)
MNFDLKDHMDIVSHVQEDIYFFFSKYRSLFDKIFLQELKERENELYKIKMKKEKENT